MSARLDVVSPAAGIGVSAVASYFIFAGGSSTENATIPVAKETTTEQTSTMKNKMSTTV